MRLNNRKSRVLVVDDEQDILGLISHLLEDEGIVPLTAHDGRTALQQIRTTSPDVLILDLKLPDLDGLEVMRKAKALDENLPVVILTAHAGVHGAVEAMRASAYEYLAKPYDHQELVQVIRFALAERQAKLNLRQLGGQIDANHELTEIMGPSDAIGRLIADINRVAQSNFSVVILGETGSGKEVVAQAIHSAGPRAKGQLVPVDCGAIPEALLESELFGHEKGAFTGSAGQKLGKFQLADGGTLLLDEILNMPLSAQAKVLRALQEKTIYRVGGTKPITIDTRVLAAGNSDLEEAATAGRFRVDLFYRLKEFTIQIPPLRQRKEDIIYLAKRFLDLTNRELHKNVRGFAEPAIQTLLNHSWPGNVRQLRSTIRRAVLLTDSVVAESHLDVHEENGQVAHDMAPTARGQAVSTIGLSLKEIVNQSTTAVEREVLLQTLRQTGGNKAKAARLLHIDYKTIQSKVRKCGITQNQDTL